MKINKIINETINKFINELYQSNISTDISDLKGSFFVLYKQYYFLLDPSQNNFIDKTKELNNFLQKEFPKFKLKINTYDDAIDFYDKYLTQLPIVVGEFHINNFSNEIPKNEVFLDLFDTQYHEVRISDMLKKIIKLFPGLKYYRIEDKFYSKDDLMEKGSENFNKEIKLPDIVYHGTSSQFMPDILKEGLKPKSDNTVFGVKHSKYIFFTTSFNTAKTYATYSVSRDLNMKNKKIVLKIDGTKLDKHKIVFDYDFYHKFVGKGNKYYDDMKGGDIDDNNNLSHSNKWYHNMGGLFKKFGYSGILYPSAITNIYIEDQYNTWKEISVNEYKRKYIGN